MQNCSSCQHGLPEQGAFCPSCGTPVRCKSCEYLLTPLARFCANCGAQVNDTNQTQAHSNGANGISAISQAPNLIRFDQDNKTCHLEARLTDPAFEVGGKVLGLVIAGRAGVSIKRSRQNHPTDGNGDERQQSLLDYIDVEADDEGDVKVVTPEPPQQKPNAAALPQSSDEAKLREIFRVTEDKELKVINTRLKQTLKKDFVERLSVLFLYGHELLTQRESVPRADLNKVLTDTKVLDPNARTWLRNNDLLSPDGDSISLSVPGREFAQEVLRQYADPNFETKWTIGSKSSARSGKAGAKDGDEAQSGGKTSKGKRPKGTSYFAQVKKLCEGGFLKKGHTGEEVKAELERRGHKFALKRVNEALVKQTKDELLTRQKNASGEWVYQNKNK